MNIGTFFRKLADRARTVAGLPPTAGTIYDIMMDGSLEEVRALTSRHPQVLDEKIVSSTVFERAIAMAGADVRRFLIETWPERFAAARNKSSAFRGALRDQDTAALDLMLKHGIDLQDTGNNGNWLHYAALHGEEASIDFLLSRGLSVNARDENGKTPVMYCMDAKRLKLLDKYGPDFSLKDNKGKTFAMLAIDQDRAGLIEESGLHRHDLDETLAYAVREKKLEAAVFLIGHGAKLDADAPETEALREWEQKKLDRILKENTASTAFLAACAEARHKKERDEIVAQGAVLQNPVEAKPITFRRKGQDQSTFGT